MNKSKGKVRAAADRAMRSATLCKALKDWFNRKGGCPDPEITEFRAWVERRADYLAANIEHGTKVDAANLFVALQVQAMGDRNAVRFSKEAIRDGFESDINCYVEEGMVYANVWLTHKYAISARRRAEAIAEEFTALGYAAEVWVDELDENSVTVNASIDFPLYAALKGKKGKK